MNTSNPQGNPASNSSTAIRANCALSPLQAYAAETIRQALAFSDSINRENGDMTSNAELFIRLIHDLTAEAE